MDWQRLTDPAELEFLIGQLVKITLALALLFGIGYNVLKWLKGGGSSERLIRGGLVLLFLLLLIPIGRWIWIDGSMILSPRYTLGRTLGLCEAPARGKGISFDYEVNGKRYTRCQPYHPIPIDSIVVSGGTYRVRYSDSYPHKGKILWK